MTDVLARLSELCCSTSGFLHSPVLVSGEPVGFFCFEFSYSSHFYSYSLFSRFGIVTPSSLPRAVLKRQSEFLAGRLSAHFSLQVLGCSPPTILGIGRHRSPIWPEGVVGSLSHSVERCTIALFLNKAAFVGVDIERILPSSSFQAVEDQVLVPAEKKLLPIYLSRYPKGVLLSLLFSSKESLFKALYPVVQAYFGFFSARFVDVSDHAEILLELTRPLHRSLPEKTRFSVQFWISKDFVRTLLVFYPKKTLSQYTTPSRYTTKGA